jgi:hypothetical protein
MKDEQSATATELMRDCCLGQSSCVGIEPVAFPKTPPRYPASMPLERYAARPAEKLLHTLSDKSQDLRQQRRSEQTGAMDNLRPAQGWICNLPLALTQGWLFHCCISTVLFISPATTSQRGNLAQPCSVARAFSPQDAHFRHRDTWTIAMAQCLQLV